MDTADNNRRRASREPISDTLFVNSIRADQVEAVGNEMRTVNGIDASDQGLQVQLDFEVLENSEIALWISPTTNTSRVMVTGTVRWVQTSDEGTSYRAGIELDEESVPEMQRWLDQKRTSR